jgi:enterochelin esterase-like enzyme
VHVNGGVRGMSFNGGMGLGPQSTGLFLVLMGAFCALLGCVAVARQMAVRVLAAALAFVPAMLFGVAAVNKYYDYYQTWGSAAADLTATSSNVPQLPSGDSRQQLARILGTVTGGPAAAQQGETVRLTVHGRLSHLTRTVYLYLPPQYFQARYARARFPAIELITGFPGQPQDWINVVGVIQSYLTLLRDGAVQPAVLVMPDANGGLRISLQCLNVWHGPQDATFLGADLPGVLARSLRVPPPGPAWGVAGYSEGGYCAADLALLYPRNYGETGVLSGYFVPGDDRLGSPVRTVNPFGADQALRALNTPMRRIRTLPVNQTIPMFWLGAGGAYRSDVIAARAFQRHLLARQPGVVVHLAPGGKHNMATWRALVPPLLEWMTPRLAYAERHPVPPGERGSRPAPQPLARQAAGHQDHSYLRK